MSIEGTMHSEKGFYVGDICYVLGDKAYYDLWIEDNKGEDGHYKTEDGIEFAVCGNGIGDGTYYDQYYDSYDVDAGVIGIVPLETIEKYGSPELVDGSLDLAALDWSGKVVLMKGKCDFEMDNGNGWSDYRFNFKTDADCEGINSASTPIPFGERTYDIHIEIGMNDDDDDEWEEDDEESD